eukprot:SM011577S24023  [mRNA]  locus=s11577:304:339:- [translate_table: standard]
MLHASALWSQD